jgi:hypothetical protein
MGPLERLRRRRGTAYDSGQTRDLPGSDTTRYQADAAPYLGRTSTGWNAPACLAHSFNNLVGNGEHAWRNGEAESLGGLEIYDQLILGWLHDRQVGRLGSFEN